MGKVFNTIGGGGTKATITNNEPSLTLTNKVASAESDITATIKTDTYKYDSGGVVNYNFSIDGTQKQSGTGTTYDFSSESFAEGTTHTIGVNVSGTGLTTSTTATKSYVAPIYPKATVTGLGSSSPSSVTFNVANDFVFTEGEVTIGSDVFIKIPKIYRKINTTDSNPQITSFTLANSKIDSTYEIYPVFLKEDGVTEMDYVLMGKYCCSSTRTAKSEDATGVTMTVGAGRTLCQNKGTGYQQMDWQIFKLWQDLLICKMKTVDTNPGTGITTDALGIVWKQQGTDQYPWLDGIAPPASGDNWVFSYKPSAYVDSPSASSTGYQQVNYARPTESGNITALGYDSNYPFVNYPKTASGSTYTTYYCDRYSYGSGSHPVFSYVGNAGVSRGAFGCIIDSGWSTVSNVRLCYRPINE